MLTVFTSNFDDSRENIRLRFGDPEWTEKTETGAGKRYAFAPGARFGVIYWQAGFFGTTGWGVAVAEEAAPGGQIDFLPRVTPGGTLLFLARGRGKENAPGPAKRALDMLEAIEAQGVALARVTADFWRAAHLRQRRGLTPLIFNPTRHTETS